MISVFAFCDPTLESHVHHDTPFTKIESPEFVRTYRQKDIFVCAFHQPIQADHIAWIAETYLPERLYFPVLGYTVDMVREIGDIIVPNVFFEMHADIGTEMITSKNRDSFMQNPRFLTSLPEQKDYYVEDFGLSLGGILVDQASKEPNEDLFADLMTAYEGDIYTHTDIHPLIDLIESDEIPALILAGVVQGKNHPKHTGTAPISLVWNNLLTTARLLSEE